VARIADLTATQLARHATNTFVFWGRQETGTRLAYHALVLDPKQPEGLARLSDFLDIEPAQPFSAAVLEYGCAQEAGLPAEARTTLQEARFHALWSWGFSRHQSGRTELGWEDFADRSQFTFDEGRYQAFIGSVLDRAGSLGNALRSAHALAGALAGLLTHRELGPQAPFEELYHPERFVRTPAYAEWLSSPADQLDHLEEERARQSTGGGEAQAR
jgi:hypothetical protein